MNDPTLADQVHQLVTENQNLRVKSDNDDRTLALLKDQYAGLSSSVESMKSAYESEIHALRTERDQAVVAKAETDRLLKQAGDLLLQAARASIGDRVPPLAIGMDDARLPAVALQ